MLSKFVQSLNSLYMLSCYHFAVVKKYSRLKDVVWRCYNEFLKIIKDKMCVIELVTGNNKAKTEAFLEVKTFTSQTS